MLGSKNMLGKAKKKKKKKKNHIIKQKEARKSNKEKGVWNVTKKLHPHP